MAKRFLRLICAGAGSGKTHRLSGEFCRLIGRQKKINPNRIIAMTFTRNAAAGLREQLRQELLKDGLVVEADQLQTSLIGTVDSVCGRLLQRFAFEAGISPQTQVIPEEDQQVLFNESIAAAFNDERMAMLEEIAERFSFGVGRNHHDWRCDLRDVIDAARANGITSDTLTCCATRSVDELYKLLPIPSEPADETDFKLHVAISSTLKSLRSGDDDTKGTRDYVALLEVALHRLERFSMPWAQWVKLTKEKPCRKSEELAEPVQAAAALHSWHVGLRTDIRDFVYILFSKAQDALENYAAFKRERGLVDFVDQERLLLDAMSIPAVQERLRSEFDVLLVDEFQDTSPIQLALFLKLAGLMGSSIWVGDPKQTIYAFRGADPSLIDAVVKEVGGSKRRDILDTSYRSRPELVRFVNALFVPAWAGCLPTDYIKMQPYRESPQGASEPLRGWVISGSNVEARAAQIGAGILELLQEAPVIWDKAESCERRAEPGDIAVLCRTHHDCQEVATALVGLGLHAALERPGLLATPEGKLTLACLRLYQDRADTLARAEIIVLTNPEPKPEEWLRERLQYLQEGNPSWAWGDDHPVIRQVLRVAERAALHSPVDVIEEISEAVDLRRLVMGWGESSCRLANVDRFRGYARTYEDCARRRDGAATMGGFLMWLQELAKTRGDCQSAGVGTAAVNVLTCHGAKGLEWPVVVVANLDREPKERLWGLSVVADCAAVDLDDPLAKRWLRYWPWPYGGHRIGTRLCENLEGTPIMAEATTAAEAEELRLLYVTLTRARDYLVLCLNQKTNPWLDLALGKARRSLTIPAEGEELLLPWDNEEGAMRLLMAYPPQQSVSPPAITPLVWVPERKGRVEYPPAIGYPSTLECVEGVTAVECTVIGRTIAVRGMTDFDALGTALHAFLAGDVNAKRSVKKRLAALERTLDAHGASDAVDCHDVISNCDRFYAYMQNRFEWRQTMTEWPACMVVGGQQTSGRIDLLLETTEGWVIVDHKSLAGPNLKWKAEALRYRAQLKAYSDIVHQASKIKVAGHFVHFVLGGVLVEFTFAS